MITIRNIKLDWGIAANSKGELFAYNATKIHLLNPKINGEELVTIYPVDDYGFADYSIEGKLPAKELTPKFAKIELF